MGDTELINSVDTFSNSLITQQQTLEIVDEFDLITIKDRIKVGELIVFIHHTNLDTISRKKVISFMMDEQIISLDRRMYVLQGWRKINEGVFNAIN